MLDGRAALIENGGAIDFSVEDAVVGGERACVLYVGGTGDLIVKFTPTGNPVTYKAVPVGFFPVQVYSVVNGSTATDVVANW